MKKFSAFSVNYPITIMMAVLGILLLGYISFSNLGMDLFPDLNNPRIFIQLRAGERPPEEMERQFVENIESVAIRQKKVVGISSVCRVGTALITVDYAWDADMDESFLDLQKSLAGFGQNLEIEEITLSQHDPNSRPVVVIGLSHPEISDMDELRKIAEGYIRNELIRLEGIAAVEIIGAEEKEVLIKTSPYLLEAHGLSLEIVAGRIQNSNITASGGSIVELGLKYIIKGVGKFQSLDDIGNVIVATKPSALNPQEMVPVYLSDIADIRFANKEPLNIVRVDGQRCVALAIYKETRYNTVKAVADLDKSLQQLRMALPGYDFRVLHNQATFIDQAISEVEETALIGILLAIIILYVFLRRVGATLIISFAIPVSIIATFNLMYFNGLTINIMTLGGLALGAGMLVDNAIVVMENIYRNLENGLSPANAAITGTAEVSGAITASTLTTIVVFLPIVYLHGAAGELFKDQAWTVAFSLISSLVVAIFVIPMLSHKILSRSDSQLTKSPLQFDWYSGLIDKFLSRRNTILLATVAVIALTILITPFVGSEFMPKGETNDFEMEVYLQEGTSLAHMDRVAQSLESAVKEILGDQLQGIYSRVGPVSQNLGEETSPELQDANMARLTIYLKPGQKEPTSTIIENLNRVLVRSADVQIRFFQEQSSLQATLGTDQAPVVIQIRGEDLQTLRNLNELVIERLKTIDDLVNIESSFDEDRPEINVVFDRIRAGAYDLDFADVGTQLRDQLQGKLVTDLENEGEVRDITIRYPEASPSDLANLYLINNQRKIRLDEIATIIYATGEKEIRRLNQTRIGIISAQIRGDLPLDQISEQIRESLADITFPANYRYEISGEELKRQESFSSLKFALLLSIILIYMVMASQFESLIHPFTILLSIPLAAVGAILIFFLLQQPLNVMAYIGIIMLVGIAVNDSIILVDAINQARREGVALRESIIQAGQRRIRPIIMTSLTTILALLPLTIGFGESSALRAPMALAVIGGLVTSTLLTLVVIPCLYYVLDQLADRIKKLLGLA